MSGSERGIDDVLLDEHTHTGKIYSLVTPRRRDIDYSTLREKLRNRTILRSLDFEDEDVVVPEVYREGDDVTGSVSIREINLSHTDYGKILYGDVVIDESNTVPYRNQDILVLRTSTAGFIVFEFDGDHYIEFLAARETAEEIAEMMGEELDDFGPAIQETRLNHGSIKEIREELDAELMTTDFTDYPEPEVSGVRMHGRGFESAREYERQETRANIQTYMMETESWIPGNKKVLIISRDGLVRSYSNCTLRQYLQLLADHILPRIQRVEDSSVLSAWSDDSIYTDSDRSEVD